MQIPLKQQSYQMLKDYLLRFVRMSIASTVMFFLLISWQKLETQMYSATSHF